MGLRQLRHPVQGVRLARARRAPSRRRSPTPRRCTGSPGSPRRSRCTSRGTWSTTTARSRAYAEDLGVALGHDQLQHVPGRRLQARQPDPRRRRASGARRSTTTSSASRSWTQTGSRDLKIWLADGTNYPGQGDIRGPPGPAGRVRSPTIYARLGEDQRLVLEYKFFEPAFYHTDVPDWGTSYAHVRRARRPGGGLPRHRPPRARAPTSSSSSRSCCGSGSSARSTSTAASTPTTT